MGKNLFVGYRHHDEGRNPVRKAPFDKGFETWMPAFAHITNSPTESFRLNKIALFLLIGVALFGSGLLVHSNQSQAEIYNISPETDIILRTAVDALFNEEFEKADEILQTLSPEDGRRPLGLLMKVIRHWWEISVNVLEADNNASAPFLEAAEKCIESSQLALKDKRTRIEANIALATTFGLLSRWSAANRAWLAAYSRGQKAASFSEKALKLSVSATDAYLPLGTFHYAQDMIRKLLGTEQSFEPSVSLSKQGLKELRIAYENGIYLSAPAGLMLAGILTNTDAVQAIPLLNELRQKLPRSAFVHMTTLAALYNSSATDELEQDANEFEKRVKEGTYLSSYQPQADFAFGLVHFQRQEWKKASRHFGDAAQSDSIKNPYVTWALLYQGYCFDAMGHRTKALKNYNLVLNRPRRFASHTHARNRYQRPFKPTDIELKKLEL